MTHGDLVKPTTFSDQVYLGMHSTLMQTEQRSRRRVQKCSHRAFPQEQRKKLPASGTLNANVIVWSYAIMGLAKKKKTNALNGASNWQTKKHRAVVFGVHTLRR